MTKDRARKQASRNRQATTGEPYVVARRHTEHVTHVFNEDFCANCDEALPNQVQGLFCSEVCNQSAQWVRYVKKVSADGRINDPDIKAGVRMKMAHILSGGYLASARRISREVRAAVIERDGGRCRSCGEPGNEVDHIAGSSRDLDNLQLLCHCCHMVKSELGLRPASPEVLAVAGRLKRRVAAEPPLRLCDDPVRWPAEWRQLKSERRRRLIVELDELGYDLVDFRGTSWQDMWDEVLEGDPYEFGDGSSGTLDDYEHGWYLQELAARDD